ncbi:hypothetical protein [Plastoroseomonas hellenica]|uniref:hypothetical protein n=1 Tax=Plastoroseomonas hellenica TaxID=2687306 RepID=UPI001BA5DE77|nr:hypothetical protein [Plastoroseomonas hellenica]MBR0647254.1 hypothetical protein [Plastoroseomonas hellenica]
MTRFLAISGAAIIVLALAGAWPALLREAPPATLAVVAGERGHGPCADERAGAPADCGAPLAWLEDGWALLSDWPGRAELRADGRRGKPATRL